MHSWIRSGDVHLHWFTCIAGKERSYKMASQAVPSSVTEQKRKTPRRQSPSGRRRGETLAAYLFLAPYLIVLGVFTIFVALYGVGLSFFKIDIGFTAPEFVGFRNYTVLFNQL